MGIHSATNVRKLALTFTRVAVWRESNQLVISSLAWRNISFFMVSKDLKHISMSVELDLNVNWTSPMKQIIERTIDEKATVLETDVFDVSITQLKSVNVGIWNKRISLNLKQLEGC